MESRSRLRKTIGILAITQVVGWGMLYYAFSIMAADIGRELQLRPEVVFGAFSWCLLVSGLSATPVGMLIDRFGGRAMMATGSLLCGVGFIILAQAHNAFTFYLAWTLLGVAMAQTLYEAAFSTITYEAGAGSRKAISTLTLFGGFASTVFWPVTLKINAAIGWRDTYLLYAAVQFALCLPLHLLLSHGAPTHLQAHDATHDSHFTLRQALREPAFWHLAFAFSANSFVFSALSAHLIPILQHYGHAAGTVVLIAALIGPMQVMGRIGEMAFARYTTAQTVGKITFGALPGALLALLFYGEHQAALATFCVLYGISNGIITIVRGTVPLALFGARNYGAISGALSGPSMVARAAGPIAVAAMVQASGAPTRLFGILLVFSVVSLVFYLFAIRQPGMAAEAPLPAPPR
jgi:predicted MFS family arabinose efflux permease